MAQQRRFGDSGAFQIATTGLMGCTVVTVVSKTGVYMAHYWENPSFSRQATFQRRVLNFISGYKPRDGEDPALDPTIFNGAEDDTRIYIMHPRRELSPNNPFLPNYDGKFVELRDLLNVRLLPGAPTAARMYVAVPYIFDENGEYESDPIEEQQWRRHAVFQYDPNARGNGMPGWRLFFEDHYFDSTNAPPGPESANDIPDIP
ncbi:hypothetical protein BO82DRAFT_411943 [Aspergillus uvarum CBS 121591]|uniref:Uncharacterized protein n=1 Tax=Aspergillus uvarum CBS 121591 TaxID=1448315 RepID=A0A319DWU4_9EURO|nr:hypothetical protein BO82DRAFT_411943 [Aspergillus uvarum CBS 121591]PYH83382.1 hypothetical protein BO82DRAFT_411943 [Aspergillus uvarum CBS 121591]